MLGYAEILCGINYDFSARLGDISVLSFLRAFGLGATRSPILGVLWYVRQLFFLLLMGPVANRLIPRSFGVGCVLICICIGWVCVDVFVFSLDAVGYWLCPYFGLLFFVGMFWARRGLGMPRRWYGLLLCIPVLGAITRYYGCIPETSFGTATNVLAEWFLVIPSGCIALLSLSPVRMMPRWVIRNSFGIYVFHTVVLHFIMLTMLQVGRVDVVYTLPGYVSIWVISAAVSLCAAEGVHLRCPRLTMWLFGGR